MSNKIASFIRTEYLNWAMKEAGESGINKARLIYQK